LAVELAGLGEGDDPVVHLAVHAPSRAEFLDVDARLVGLLATAAGRATGDCVRARVLARLGYELLGDASAGPRRRTLVDEALRLARRCGDPRTVAAVLDARLHALGAGLRTSDTGPALDAVARDAYRARLAALDAQLDAADRVGDPRRAEAARVERDAVLDELRRASGLGGRPRSMDAEAERARVNVTRTLGAAIDRIAANAPRAAAHLDASLHTGRLCRYQPVPGGPARWHV